MSYEDVTQDPYRALAYCQGVLEILQNHYLSHYLECCKSALSEGDAVLAAHYLNFIESCINLLAKTIADTLENMAKGEVP